jgi:putative DNA primase/helicase
MASLDARAVARALGGDIAGRNAILVPGPGHSRRDRSLSIKLDPNAPEGFVVHSFAGDDPIRCREHVRFALRLEKPDRPQRPPQEHRPQYQPGNDRRVRDALTWFGEAGPLIGSPAWAYLASRRVAGVIPDDGTVLRFHPRCPFNSQRTPALVALFRDIRSDEPRAIHRRSLSPAGKALGHWVAYAPTAGAAIKLCPSDAISHAAELAVGEGVETTLSGMQCGFEPAWAVGDAGHLGGFPVLDGVSTLTILVDNDDNGRGQRAALQCSERWTDAGRTVERVTPVAAGADLNDVTTCRKSPTHE